MLSIDRYRLLVDWHVNREDVHEYSFTYLCEWSFRPEDYHNWKRAYGYKEII